MAQSILPDDLPAKKIHVGVAFLVVLGLTAILYVVDLLLIKKIAAIDLGEASSSSREWGHHLSILRSVLENLIAGAWAAFILALLFRVIISIIDPRDRVIEIAPNAIGNRLRKNAQDTLRYVFIGNTATYVTVSILPILVDAAAATGSPRTIDLYIIDPTDEPSLTSYASFKTQVANAKTHVADRIVARWTRPIFDPVVETNDEVMSKLLASIYLAAFASVQSAVQMRVHLRRSFTPFRADMSDKEVVLTQESAVEPGVAFSYRGVFYSWYHKEAAAQLTQARTLDLSANHHLLRPLCLAHPSRNIRELRASIVSMVNCFPELQPLVTNKLVINLTAKRVAKLRHSY